MSQKIDIVGSGNVAWHLCNALSFTDYEVVNICSRNKNSAKILADQFGANAVEISEIAYNSEIVIIAVDDDEIENVSAQINSNANTIVLHTSGSISIDVLKQHENFGCIWFVQSLTKEVVTNYDKIPTIIYYNNEDVKEKVDELAKSISTNVHILADESRKKMHLAAVVSNNFSNHLLSLSQIFCEENNLDFNLLQPILETTISKAFKTSPQKAQTGPAIRNDEKSIEAHLSLLNSNEALLNIYKIFTESIIKTHQS